MRSPPMTGTRRIPWRRDMPIRLPRRSSATTACSPAARRAPPKSAPFMQNNPDWPQQGLLETRWEQALVDEPDQTAALAQCQSRLPAGAPRAAPLRERVQCRPKIRRMRPRRRGGPGPASASPIRRMSPPFSASGAACFSRRTSGRVSRRSPGPGLRRPRPRSRGWGPPTQPEAQVWVALNENNPDGQALLTALPAARQQDPGLFLAAARFLRHNAGDPDAYAFWLGGGNTAMAAGLPVQQHALWGEANHLVRALLTDGDAPHALCPGGPYQAAGPGGPWRRGISRRLHRVAPAA